MTQPTEGERERGASIVFTLDGDKMLADAIDKIVAMPQDGKIVIEAQDGTQTATDMDMFEMLLLGATVDNLHEALAAERKRVSDAVAKVEAAITDGPNNAVVQNSRYSIIRALKTELGIGDTTK